MHEMSIAHSILTQVEELTQTHRAKKALRVKIKVGTLSGVMENQLTLAFDIYKKEFACCSELELLIQTQLLVIKCLDCGKITQPEAMDLGCMHCQGGHTQVLEGNEMILEQVELDLA
jgi:hydrogenase nickel incorporation protein HypA/HybF